MNLKEKLEALRKSIKTALDTAETLIGEGKFAEANVEQEKADKFAAEAQTVSKAIAQRETEEKTKLETERDEALKAAKSAEAKNKEAERLSGLGEQTTQEEEVEVTSAKAVNQMRYGETTEAVKAVISDLYGSKTTYNERRHKQMEAFVKYIRFGDSRMTAQEAGILDAHKADNFLLQPDVIAFEIKSGRSVAEMKATLVEGSLDLGGYLVPEDYRTEIIKRLMGLTVVRPRARVITTTRDSVEWPRLEGGPASTVYTSAVRVTWVEELPLNASVSLTNPTFGMLRIPIYTVMARTDLSRNLLEDSAFNLLDTIAGLFSEAMTVDEDNQFLTGTGGATPVGVLGTRTGAELGPITGVANQVSGNASALTADGILDLVYSIPAQYRKAAVFAMARLTQASVRKLKDGIGRYLWQDSYQMGQPANLVGFPVFESEQLPSITANNFPVIFGDWAGYIIADRVGMTVERVTDSTLIGQNKVALFARRRLGGAPAEPWRFAVQKVST
jgi:HK97 family phage major capsid protein